MKILHVVQDPEKARVPSSALHGFAQNVTLETAGSPAGAAEWLDRNPDTAVVILEVEAQSGAPFVRELRAARLDTAVVVVGGSGRLDTAIAALNAGADGYLLASPSLERDLPELVAQAMDRASSRARERAKMAGELGVLRRQLARESRMCAELQRQSLQLEDTLGRLDRRRADEAGAFAELLDVRRRAFDEQCAQLSESRDALAADLASAMLAIEREREARADDGEAARTAQDDSERRHADDTAAAAAKFADLESRHTEALERHATVSAEHDVAYATLERRLTEAQSAHQDLLERATADRAAAGSALEGERQARAADRETARAAQDDSDRRHADEISAASAKFADLELRHHAALEKHATVSDEHNVAYAALERRLADAHSEHQDLLERAAADRETARAAYDDSARRHADETAAAAAKFADLESRHHAALEEHATASDEHKLAYAALERRLAQSQSHYQNLLKRAADDRAAAMSALERERQARTVDREAARAAHHDVQRRLTETQSAHQTLLERAALDRAAAEKELAVAVAARRQSEHRATRILDVAVTRETELIAELETESAAKAVAESQASAARMAAARGRDRSLLVVSRYRQRVRVERFERESDLRRATAETTRLQLSFDELQSAFQQLDELAGSHASARLRLEALVAERDRQLAEDAERHLVVQEDAERAMARLRKDLVALRHEVDETRADADALCEIADRVPDLEAQLEKSRQEKRRQFERAPYGLCRCSASGTIIEANHSFVALLGYRRAEDVKELSWLKVTKERTGDLGWLLERAQATRKAETVETQWTTRERRTAIVRLQALVTSDGAIDIVAEDVTAIRELEGRLRQAQKMEAVGRLATEVAFTCDAVLGDVVREARDSMNWLESAAVRIPIDRMMEELTRARGLLRRLDSYGDEQKRALEPVSAQRVLQDLAPVLRRLVGERISLELPKASGRFPVDVDAERLERVLTNVAGYARQRMPTGGQVKIDLATIAIGRRFAAGHSNVRAGEHVLITVTELPTARALEADAPRNARPNDAAGMELGVLVDLISSCGGHLWLEAQPAGNMVVKIHLPKLAIKEERGGRLSQWLRAASVANILT
jgi:hypothetical protein